jgi:hypothetical protein
MHEVAAELALGHAGPHCTERVGRRRQQHRIDHLRPDREVPENDQGQYAEYRQIWIEPFHPRRTSR